MESSKPLRRDALGEGTAFLSGFAMSVAMTNCGKLRFPLEAVLKRMDPNTVQAVLAKLQAPPLGQISDLKTLQRVVLGLEALAGPNDPENRTLADQLRTSNGRAHSNACF